MALIFSRQNVRAHVLSMALRNADYIDGILTVWNWFPMEACVICEDTRQNAQTLTQTLTTTDGHSHSQCHSQCAYDWDYNFPLLYAGLKPTSYTRHTRTSP